MGVGSFLVVLRVTPWPGGDGRLNLSVNLPTFQPAAGSDVAARLRRDGSVNLALGILLPYVLPPVAAAIGAAHGLSVVRSDLVLVWVASLWAFLPASLILRGIALRRVAAAIEARAAAAPAGGALPAH